MQWANLLTLITFEDLPHDCIILVQGCPFLIHVLPETWLWCHLCLYRAPLTLPLRGIPSLFHQYQIQHASCGGVTDGYWTVIPRSVHHIIEVTSPLLHSSPCTPPCIRNILFPTTTPCTPFCVPMVFRPGHRVHRLLSIRELCSMYDIASHWADIFPTFPEAAFAAAPSKILLSFGWIVNTAPGGGGGYSRLLIHNSRLLIYNKRSLSHIKSQVSQTHIQMSSTKIMTTSWSHMQQQVLEGSVGHKKRWYLSHSYQAAKINWTIKKRRQPGQMMPPSLTTYGMIRSGDFIYIVEHQ